MKHLPSNELEKMTVFIFNVNMINIINSIHVRNVKQLSYTKTLPAFHGNCIAKVIAHTKSCKYLGKEEKKKKY